MNHCMLISRSTIEKISDLTDGVFTTAEIPMNDLSFLDFQKTYKPTTSQYNPNFYLQLNIKFRKQNRILKYNIYFFNTVSSF